MVQRRRSSADLRSTVLMTVVLVLVAVLAFVITVAVRSGLLSDEEEPPASNGRVDLPTRTYVLEPEDTEYRSADLEATALSLADRLYATGLTAVTTQIVDGRIHVRVPLVSLENDALPELDDILISHGGLAFAPVISVEDDVVTTIETEDGDVHLGETLVDHEVVWGLRAELLDGDRWTLAVDLDVNVESPWPALMDAACTADDPQIAVLLAEQVVTTADVRDRQCSDTQATAPQFGVFDETEARRLAGTLTSPQLAVPVTLVDTYDG